MNGKKSSMTKWLRNAGMLVLGLCATLILCSCALVEWFRGDIKDQEIKDMDKDLGKAVEKQTAYDNSLKKFGLMLEAYNINPVRVQSKVISNQTAEKELPDSVSGMLSSSINKIGATVIYVPFDPNYVISETTTGGDIQRALPKIVIAGGITEFDKDLIEKKRDLKTKANIGDNFGSNYNYDGGTSYKAESGVSRMTLDLQLMDYQTQTYISGVQTINSINLRKTELGWAVGFYFEGNGLAFDYSLSKKQGKYHALRLLVELSALEIMGRYFDVPYWRCIENATPDTRMINKLREEFEGLSTVQQYAYLKEYLFFHGVKGLERGTSGVSDSELTIIRENMKKLNCHDYAALFIKLWETVPLNEARKRNREYNKTIAENAQKSQDDYTRLVNQYNNVIEQADSFYKQGNLAQAKEFYRQASNLLPDQQDPKDMIAKIDLQTAAASQAAA
ncbi:MAG: hypothetical protein WC071_06920, partial [Victivallaceae bacterium]